MATLLTRLQNLTTAIGNKLNQVYDEAEKVINKKQDLTSTDSNHFPSVPAVKTALNGKVDKVTGKGLSTNDYTTAEKDKLAGLESSKYKGQFLSKTALDGAFTSDQLSAGDYADVDGGSGSTIQRYVWDSTDLLWEAQVGESSQLTASQVKTLYGQNPDTEHLTTAEKQSIADTAALASTNQTNISTNATDITSLENELITYYKSLGTEFPDYTAQLNTATPDIVVV